MNRQLCILFFAVATSACASTPAQPLTADKIMERAKVEFRSCCRISSSNYDLSVLKNVDGNWTVSAIPRLQSSAPDVITAQGGGDVHLFYDRSGNLKGKYRGQ